MEQFNFLHSPIDREISGAERKAVFLQIDRRGWARLSFDTLSVTDSPSAWPCEGPGSASMRALGRHVGRCGLVAGLAGCRLSRSGQRCTLPFDPELYVALSVPTSIRRESLRQRHLGRGFGKNQLH